MPYMLLIVEPTAQRGTRTDAEGREVYDRMLRWRAGLKERGLLLSGESLKSPEMIGGFFLVDCNTREEAIAIATECPAAQWCTVEVRSLAPCYE